jgi:iron complex transport system substrate-binding protein
MMTHVKLLLVALSLCVSPIWATPKIVSLAPGVTEIVSALGMGDALVGISNACDYPESVVRNRPKTGPFLSPDIESITALSPTIVIGIGVSNSPELQALENTGVQVLLLPNPDTIPDLLTAITIIGNAIGKPAEGKKLADSMNLSIQRLRKSKPEFKFSVLAILWNPPLVSAAGNTLIAQVITAAGAVNTLEAGSVRYPKINRETMVYRNPDVVLILDPQLEEKIVSDSAITFTKAAIDKRIISDIPATLIARPGPRIVEGITQLQNALREFKP